jgi:Raf kinase inhibitor-like YbhB/YbcL family protein
MTPGEESPIPSTTPATLDVHCDAFAEGMPIAERHSGYYENLSPDITWTRGPEGTKSYALLVEDPDAPGGIPFVHWIAANLPPTMSELPQGMGKEGKPAVMQGGIQGNNGSGALGYTGPKPEAGPAVHHYHFRVFAIDTELNLQPGFERDALIQAATGHVLAQGETIGTFARRQP